MTVIIYNFITRQFEMMILVKKNWLMSKIRKIAKLNNSTYRMVLKFYTRMKKCPPNKNQ